MSKTADAAVNFGQSGKAFLEGLKQLTELNSQTITTLMGGYTDGFQAAASSKTPDELFKLQAAALKAMPEKITAYIQQVKEIFAAASAEQRDAVQAQFTAMQAKFFETIDGALKNIPGSENTVKMMKMAISATNEAYEGASKMSKQISDATDANIVKFTESATKATKTAAKTSA